MGLADLPVPRSKEGPAVAEPATATEQREELVRRVASSSTFEKSLRLRAFLLYVCRCALDNRADAATEPQIGIHVYERRPGYNPNEDNIVRSQARLLRMKLEHYFASEGKDEPVVITIPKGRYLPVFETRSEPPLTPGVPTAQSKTNRLLQIMVGVAVLCVLAVVWLGYLLIESSSRDPRPPAAPAGSVPRPGKTETGPPPTVALAPGVDEIRIAAGHTGDGYIDMWGRRWESDRYYTGGVSQPGPQQFFPPVADGRMFQTMREATSDDRAIPQTQYEFRYDIPLHSGAYELRLYFADPLRRPDVDNTEDAQNERRFQINLNGRPLLVDFDPIADAGSAAVAARVFRDVSPAADGKLHLVFVSSMASRPFVSAVELTPGTPGKLMPIRIAAHRSELLAADGTRWSGDNYFIGGRTRHYEDPETAPRIPELYTSERYGNFSYAIPVAPGSYTVRLHFLESFFSPLVPIAACQGVGCRVFDVTCNGVMLLQDFDITQAGHGTFQPVAREFRGLHPNGQGKLLLSFSPKVNYAEVRAIEVLDEAK